MIRMSRGLHVVVGAMGIAIIILAVLLVSVAQQAASTAAASRRMIAANQRLIHGLQQQVRDCRAHRHCAPPLTRAPTRITLYAPTVPRSNPPERPPDRSAAPRPTDHPTPSHSPTPRPTPTPTHSPFCVGPICLETTVG